MRTLTLILLTLAITPAAYAHGGVPGSVDRALHHASRVYRVPYWQLRSVSYCESRWRPWAVGSGSHGLFQFQLGTFSRTPYRGRSVYSAWWNALAAAWLVRRDGGWWEWTCRP